MDELNFSVKEITSSPDFGEFDLGPLEPGYGTTIGHALRRVLYTSIAGTAITSVRIAGAQHKFSTLPGLKENIIDLLLNLQELNLRLPEGKETATVTLSVKGARTVTAEDLKVSEGVEVVDKSQYIGSLSGDKAKLEIELTIQKGFGYQGAVDQEKTESLGVIPTDAVFSPVKRVTYTVSATRVGRRTDLDKLVLKVWTNGTVTPKEALTHAAKILTNSFMQIFEPKASVEAMTSTVASSSIPQETLKMTIDELDLPTRIYNSLRNGGIETIEQLLAIPHKELITMRNMGGKSISVIEEKLKEKGVSLNV